MGWPRCNPSIRVCVLRVNGQIMRVYFHSGAGRDGGALFLIDPRPYQAARDRAQGRLAHDMATLGEAKPISRVIAECLPRTRPPPRRRLTQAYLVSQDRGTVAVDQANVENAMCFSTEA